MDNIKTYSQRISDVQSIIDDVRIRSNPFSSDPVKERFMNRCERIILALGLVTNNIPLSDTVRDLVRNSSNTLMQKALLIDNQRDSVASDHARGLIATIRYLITIVRLLLTAGYVSSLNARALVEALDELALSAQVISTGDYTFGRSDFFPREEMLMQSREPQKDSKTVLSKTEKDVTKYEVIKSTNYGQSKKDMSDRAQNILACLSNGALLSIKEIRIRVPQYSEKMIQRELALLVSDGRVRKVGEKRWSRYVLSL